jgi:FixJ family two-component response regulator
MVALRQRGKASAVVQGGRVFIVENDAVVRDSLRVLLEAHQFDVCDDQTLEGLVRHFAAQGRSKASCLLLDMNLPGMDGIEFLQKLIAHGVDLPVVIMTGGDAEAIRRRVEKAGVFALIEKPWAVSQLLAVVQGALASDRGTTI